MIDNEEYVILVDNNDVELGKISKIQAHKFGLLHRAISIFIYNSKNQMLLQQRAEGKYHSPLLWTNACCSHPRENENYEEAAHRRLKEELGFETKLEYLFNFIYKEKVGENLWEHELDYVFKGVYDNKIDFNKSEVKDIKWMTIEEIQRDIIENPNIYTEWFKIIFNKYLKFS